jgi:hypothetical protein
MEEGQTTQWPKEKQKNKKKRKMIYKAIHRKQKIEKQEPHKNRKRTRLPWKGSHQLCSWSTSSIGHVTVK